MNQFEFIEKTEFLFKEKIGFDISKKQCQQLFIFMNLLIERNKVMNLTSIVIPDEIIMKHFVDSCIAIKFYNISELNNKTIVDVGTGAGFPGLPLAIILPKTNFVLNDTLGKRINFLKEVIYEMNIKNVTLIKSRAEDFDHEEHYRETFDYVVSRGVAKISVISEYCLPLLKIGGKMLSYKLDNCNEELKEGEKAINILGGVFHVKHSYTLLESEPQRCIVEINKIKSTPSKYPRKAGTPAKTPL